MSISSMEPQRTKSGTPRRNLVQHHCYSVIITNFINRITMGKIKENWAWVLFVTFLTACLSLGSQFLFRGCDHQATTIENAVSKDDLDKKEISIKGYVDTQDNAIKATLATSCSTTISRMDRMQKGIDAKADKDDFDKLWNLAIKNNDILMQIAIKNGIKVQPYEQ